MYDDERQIRELLATWQAATAAGDVPTLLGLLADDIVFLVAGQPPLGKDEFAASFAAMLASHHVEPVAEPREVLVRGNLAYCWPSLRVAVTPRTGGATRRLADPTLTVLRRGANGGWLIARGASLLTPER